MLRWYQELPQESKHYVRNNIEWCFGSCKISMNAVDFFRKIIIISAL